MAKRLNETGIQSGQIVRANHVSQSIDAFTGQDAYNINISGSLEVTGSLLVSGSNVDLSNSTSLTGSIISASSIIGTFTGDGTGLTNVSNIDEIALIYSGSNNAAIVPQSGSNTSDGAFSTVGGGASNVNNSERSTIAGGDSNAIASTTTHNSIGGGQDNSIVLAGSHNTIGGGNLNIISGSNSGILGGYNNVIEHDNSFIIGSNLTSSADNTTYMDNVYVSGSLEIDNLILLDDLNVPGNITASGNISASGDIITNTLTASGLNYPSADGVDGQVIVTDGAGNLLFGHGEKLHLQVRNDDSVTIPAGTPIYSTGEIGGSERIKVRIASASDASKMPAIGITETELNTTSTKDGFAIINGVYNTNITPVSSTPALGDNIYVHADGGVTTIKPSGSNLIQNIGTVLRTNGSVIQGMKVSSIDRTNDVPNLLDNTIFFGSGSDQTQQIHISGALDQTIINNITASGNISSSGDIFGVTGSFSKINQVTNITDDGNELTLRSDDLKLQGDTITVKKGDGTDVVTIDTTTTPGPEIDSILKFTGATRFTSTITASIISASGDIFGETGSFSHLKGNSPITVGDSITFQQPITASSDISSSVKVYGSAIYSAGAFFSANTQSLRNVSNQLQVAGALQWDGVTLGRVGKDMELRGILTSNLTASNAVAISGANAVNADRLTADTRVTTPEIEGSSGVLTINSTNVNLAGSLTASGHISGSSTTTGSFGSMVLTSPDGTSYFFTVNNDGHLSLTGSAI